MFKDSRKPSSKTKRNGKLKRSNSTHVRQRRSPRLNKAKKKISRKLRNRQIRKYRLKLIKMKRKSWRRKRRQQSRHATIYRPLKRRKLLPK